MAAVAMTRLDKAAAKLAFVGVRYPDMPILPNLVEGPFASGVGSLVTAAVPTTNDVDLIKGATPLFTVDYKLRNYAGIQASTVANGLLWIDNIGIDFSAAALTDANFLEIMPAFSIIHKPTGSQRYQVIPFAACARIGFFATSTTATDTTKYGGQPQQPYFRTPGGSWKVDLQSDFLYVSMTNASGTGPTLGSTAKFIVKIGSGAWMTLPYATQLDLLGADVVCGEAGSEIPQIMAARKALMQHTAGGLTG